MARFKLFGPLVRVPAQVLNLIQEALLDWRGDGTDNTMGPNLNTDALAFNQRRVHISLDQGVSLFGAAVSSTIDWRDRVIDVDLWIDPDHDIRPGRSGDLAKAQIYVKHSFYSGLGGNTTLVAGSGNILGPIGNVVTLRVDPAGGGMLLFKGFGYLHMRVSSGCQIKERS